jgi:hypothetical protein
MSGASGLVEDRQQPPSQSPAAPHEMEHSHRPQDVPYGPCYSLHCCRRLRVPKGARCANADRRARVPEALQISSVTGQANISQSHQPRSERLPQRATKGRVPLRRRNYRYALTLIPWPGGTVVRHKLGAVCSSWASEHRLSCPARPNPSLKWSPNGVPPGPGRRYPVHFRQPRPVATPLRPT